MYRFIILFFLIINTSTFSQSLSVFDVDTLAFPTLKAKFFVLDSLGKRINNLSESNFEVKENGQPRIVTKVSCPNPNKPVPISSVLTIDVSGSMSLGGLDIAKAAANTWINMLPKDSNECAITSFNDNSYINQDFTNNKNILMSAVNSLSCKGGTSYNSAMVELPGGGIQIAKTGKFKRVIVFLTDGAPNFEPDTTQIISEAKANNIYIYCVTIGFSAPQCMKYFSSQTGGLCYENINSKEEAEDCFRKILIFTQGVEPCTIEWQSDISCIAGITNVEFLISNINLKENANYQSPNTSLTKLEFNPTYIRFNNPTIGVKKDTIIKVTARNANFTIANITSSNPAFTITPTSFVLNSGQSMDLTVSYIPADSGYNYCRFDIENNLCTTKYYASGGWMGKKPTFRTLKLLKPNGGEVFVVGRDTVTTWEGVSPDVLVKLEYSTNNGNSWVLITDTAKNLNYHWRIPKTPSNQCLARVTAASKSENLGIDMVLIPSGTFQMGNTGTNSGDSDEKPVHTVIISKDFLMSKYEITQMQYEAVMGTNPSDIKGEKLPVEQVSWYDAIEFCNKLSNLEGLDSCYSGNGDSIVCDWNANGYRLPTEAEWEYACKAGSTTDFYNGDLTNSTCTPIDTNLDMIGWYCGNSGYKIYNVGGKEPNLFGLYDMSGNVYEWCWDLYGKYSNTTVVDPNGANSGSTRVYRGGSCSSISHNCRSSIRYQIRPLYSDNSNGFRISRTY